MAPSDALLSILIPVKNAQEWIIECVESIQQQSFRYWECLLVDDHSTDNTPALLEQRAAADGRFRPMTNRGEGIIDALNTAMEASKGQYISRMDADDRMPPRKLELLMGAVEGSMDKVATGKVRYFASGPISAGYVDYEAWLNQRIDQEDHWAWRYRECVVASANWITHRSNVFFAPGLYPEDYAHTLHWYGKGLKISSVKEVTHLWREHPKRTSRTSLNYQQKAFFKLKIKYFIENERRQGVPLVVMGNNQKSKLCVQLLNECEEAFQLIDLTNLEQVSEMAKPQVLVTIYPKLKERQAISEFLEHLNLVLGKDWWWL